MVIGGDSEDGLASGPVSESELRGKYANDLLNPLGGVIKDLAGTDVRTLVDATQGGANQPIWLAMQPTRSSLAADMRIIDD